MKEEPRQPRPESKVLSVRTVPIPPGPAPAWTGGPEEWSTYLGRSTDRIDHGKRQTECSSPFEPDEFAPVLPIVPDEDF